ncbi:hypothetical protein R5N98_12565 [Tenacibaculum maritimum]|uniref:hypothetical protein n=1 Tax=Tenacibaculum maritimum TaxID=107401 RepID=UPI00388FAB9D
MIDLSILNIVLISICIILLILIVFVFSKATKRIDRLEKNLRRAKEENDKLQFKNQELRKQTPKHLNTEEVKTKISQITNEPKSVSNIDNNAKYSQEEEEKPLNVTFDIPKVRKVFLPSPFDEKRFSIEDVSFDRNQSSLYYIDLDLSEKSGNIYILEDSDFTKALNSPAQFLEKVCLFENAFSNNATGIENIIKGTVVLDGDDWLVKEKIRIKFI